jgi:Na+/H+ antiporter NhaA
MPTESRSPALLEGRTAWGRSVETPLRDFLRTETGSAAILLGATLTALAWVNLDTASYVAFWHTTLSIRLGSVGLALDLRHWINSGLMTFFFLVIGLEARREFDVGELRQRSRAMLPLVAGVGGMVVPVLIYLAFNSGLDSQKGWGTAMSTDTAFALGMLALVGARRLDRLRAFLLTVVVIDDIVALLVIALAYTGRVALGALLAAAGLFAIVLIIRALHVRGGWLYFALGLAVWIALFESGVEPVVVGLAMGLLTYAYPAARSDLETATERFRSFREQPTPELARTARAGVQSAISPNDRLQHLFHPWTSYVIVPLFALANAGIVVNTDFLRAAVRSPITLGILIGYVVGKPAGVIGASTLVSLLSRGRLRPLVGWASVVGSGTIAGIGFTVSLLIATLAFDGRQLEEAKLGVLAGALVAATLTWVVFRATALLPKTTRARALLGTSRAIVDLVPPVDAERDHIRGPREAPVTLVEYGDFECPYCGLAEDPIRELLADSGDVRYVWRHLPLNDVHPRAQLAAEGAEAAAAQNAFWEMHDVLLGHQRALSMSDLALYAEDLGLDVDRFVRDLQRHQGASRIAEDVDSADSSGVSGTPSFFVNGRRHEGAYDIAALRAAAKTARVRAAIDGAAPARDAAA